MAPRPDQTPARSRERSTRCAARAGWRARPDSVRGAVGGDVATGGRRVDRTEIAAFLRGWELVPPGLVPAPDWHPYPGSDPQPAARQHRLPRWPANPDRSPSGGHLELAVQYSLEAHSGEQVEH
ncbi:hypothetical protein DN069_07840 [Streptacidiphilus pinicola]|uniref:Uncharacterized protein n=1 Tax=Streptacidiphilus pinicola TaxID=2219663 RepID=A0A2X0IM44_9ACTN|nr:hypothetical protein DN069_07840 [Streptacidiphilus pinicola]